MPPAILIPLAVSAISSAASYGVQALLNPRHKNPPTDKGKYDDIRITGSDYGAFIPRGWGIFRIAGNIVFSNGVQTYTVSSTTGGGKKQGGGQQEINYIYKTSAGVLVCRGVLGEFRKIWADTTVIHGGSATGNTTTIEAESGTLAGGASSVAGSASGGHYVTNLGLGG